MPQLKTTYSTNNKKKLSDQQQNQNDILLFPSFLFGSRGTLANSHLQFVFSRLFWANSITDPHSAACAAHACRERAVMFPSFLPKEYFSGTTSARVFPASPSSTYHPAAAEAAEPPPILRRQGRPGAPGSAVAVRVRAQDSPIRPKLSDKVLRNFFILLIFSADCESIMSHMGGDPPGWPAATPATLVPRETPRPSALGLTPCPREPPGAAGQPRSRPGKKLYTAAAPAAAAASRLATARLIAPSRSPPSPAPLLSRAAPAEPDTAGRARGKEERRRDSEE